MATFNFGMANPQASGAAPMDFLQGFGGSGGMRSAAGAPFQPGSDTMGPLGGYFTGTDWLNFSGPARPNQPMGNQSWLDARLQEMLGSLFPQLGMMFGDMANWKGRGEGRVPGEWQPGDAPAGMVDPSAMIRASLPGIREQQDIGFADAARRAGASGAMTGSPYMSSLGDVARRSTEDITKLTQQALMQTGENAAQREYGRGQSALDRSLQAWQTHGDWDLRAQDMADQDQNLWLNNAMNFLQFALGYKPNPGERSFTNTITGPSNAYWQPGPGRLF